MLIEEIPQEPSLQSSGVDQVNPQIPQEPMSQSDVQIKQMLEYAMLDSIKERLDQLMARKSSSTSQSSATVVLTSFPTTTTILKVITPEIVIPSKRGKGEPSIFNEFKATFFLSNSEYTRPGKESSSIYFPPARPYKNEYKLLGQEIKSYKDSADEALKTHFAIIFREG